MNWGIRGFVLAAGAAALISTQAVYAAPQAHRAVGVDPLVSLSVLGTTQSRASLVADTLPASRLDLVVQNDATAGTGERHPSSHGRWRRQ